MWLDLTLSKKTPVKPLRKQVSVRYSNEEVIKELVFMKARCNSVKKCSNNGCSYVCSSQKVVNHCSKHGETAGLIKLKNCACHLVYVKPTNEENKERWIGIVNGPHNHDCPPMQNLTLELKACVSDAISKDPSTKTSQLLVGQGLDCMPMAVCMGAADPTKMANFRRKCLSITDFDQS